MKLQQPPEIDNSLQNWRKLGIPLTTLHRILRKDTVELKPFDHQQCCIFVDWVHDMYQNDPDFDQKFSSVPRLIFNSEQ